MRWSALILLAGLVAGCASHIPPSIREAPPGNPALSEARAYPERFQGSTVRWGGTIAGVENTADGTEVEVVARELEGYGRPLEGDRSEGRFIARFPGFLDPMIYSPGRLLTVTGSVTGMEARTIEEYSYRYPVVAAKSHHLWPELPAYRHRYYDPWFYDPWYYDPWYRDPFYRDCWPRPWYRCP